MTRKISLPTIVLVFASALTVSLAGCGSSSGEAQFTETQAPTAEETQQAIDYQQAYESAAQDRRQQQ